MASGLLVGIFLKRFHGGPMDAHSTAMLETARGLAGNADFGGRRQVTIVSRERWNELMSEITGSLGPEARRGNLIVSGINLENSRGRKLIVGACTLRIGGETRPCELMEETAPGLQAAMRARWGGGAFAEVVHGGRVSIGDSVRWETVSIADT
jgi:MOSC domain-containing protein YiiM